MSSTPATRRSIGRLANSIGTEEPTTPTESIESQSSTSRHSRIGADSSENSDTYEESIDVSTPRSEVSRRETRSMRRNDSVSTDGFSMKLRSREGQKRVLEESESENESGGEETALQRRRRRGRPSGRMLRKRRRVSSDSDDSGDVPLLHSMVTTSRGRVVKPTAKFF